MSIKVMGEVWESSSTKGSTRLVLLALADFANDQGYCFPSIQSLAIKSALTERNVQVILRDLERRGELVTLRGAGRGHVNAYWVLPPATTSRLTQEGKTPKNFHPFTELEKKVKLNDKKVQLEVEKAKNDAERVNSATPGTTKNLQEPSGTTNSSECENSVSVQTRQPTRAEGVKSRGHSAEARVALSANAMQHGAARRAWAAWLEERQRMIPDWLDQTVWQRWLNDLDERRARVTSARLAEQLERLQQLSNVETQADLVARAIAGGWATFYPSRAAVTPIESKPGSSQDRYGRYR
jgi:Helix-turn-helix domain